MSCYFYPFLPPSMRLLIRPLIKLQQDRTDDNEADEKGCHEHSCVDDFDNQSPVNGNSEAEEQPVKHPCCNGHQKEASCCFKSINSAPLSELLPEVFNDSGFCLLRLTAVRQTQVFFNSFRLFPALLTFCQMAFHKL